MHVLDDGLSDMRRRFDVALFFDTNNRSHVGFGDISCVGPYRKTGLGTRNDRCAITATSSNQKRAPIGRSEGTEAF
jgi:hypothetical protein